MLTIKRISIVAVAIALAACSQTAYEAYNAPNEKPKVYNACQKINALINEYDNQFERVKGDKIKTRMSNIWKAKHHLIGQDCQVWAWDKNHATYSCSTAAPSKEVAFEYFNNAKTKAAQCLGSEWTIAEAKRNKDEGLKAEFSSSNSQAIVATHVVPTKGLFNSEWTVYYYIGNAKM